MAEKKKIFIKGLFAAVLLSCILPGVTMAETAGDIMRKMEKSIRGEYSSGTLEMEVVTPSWSRSREIAFWLSGQENVLLRITAPAQEAGEATLRVGNIMWQYMPSVERAIKLPVESMMMQPWRRSNFTYDDIMNATSLLDDYSHKLMQDEVYEDIAVWKIESVPNPGVPVVWGRQVFFVGKDYLPRRQEFYDERGRLVKALVFSGFKKMGGRIFPSNWTMTDKMKEGSYTVLRYKEIQFDIPIKTDIFSLRELRQ